MQPAIRRHHARRLPAARASAFFCGDSMFVLSWVAIFLAVPATWLIERRAIGVALLVIGYGAALASGMLGAAALTAIVVLIVLAYAVLPPRPPAVRRVAHALFIVLGIALILHGVPGFHNPRVIHAERFTVDALPFSMYLNLDKPLVAFWLLLTFRWIRGPQNTTLALAAGIGGWLLTAVVCLGTALAMRLVVWEPKWPADALLFLVNNLLLVSVVEEAFFRGYLQGVRPEAFAGRRLAVGRVQRGRGARLRAGLSLRWTAGRGARALRAQRDAFSAVHVSDAAAGYACGVMPHAWADERRRALSIPAPDRTTGSTACAPSARVLRPCIPRDRRRAP
jgi:membrane protease YdiL (CAAX protease family)